MNTSSPRLAIAVAVVAFALGGHVLIGGAVRAQSTGGDYTVRKAVIAGGSSEGSGGPFTVRATAGQHDAGVATGGSFTVRAGYWPATAVAEHDGIFRDGFE